LGKNPNQPRISRIVPAAVIIIDLKAISQFQIKFLKNGD